MKPVVLAILDGVGIATPHKGNAYEMAKKPNLDHLFNKYAFTTLEASGNSVGLPDGQMGNSEVGHINIGAGRIVYQQLELINKAFTEATFASNEEFVKLIEHARASNNRVHVMGLLSDGGVHSHNTHFKNVVQLLSDNGLDVFSHAFLDGRDVLPSSALAYVKDFEAFTTQLNNGQIMSVSGRYYAMDRDNNLDRTTLAYHALLNDCKTVFDSASEGVMKSYEENVLDEFVKPFVVSSYEGIKQGDSIIFINFRPDRAIQISKMLLANLDDLYYVTMTRYPNIDSHVLFDNVKLDNTLGEFLADNNFKQLRIAETEKYAHVTFFFDGGIEKDLVGMHKVLIASPKVATYDLKPEMSAYEVTDNLLSELDAGYDVVILNFANGDMIGHTGNIAATIKAIEAVDENIGRIYEKVSQLGGALLITADHGNSEMLLDDYGNTITSHTSNLVPFCVTVDNVKLIDDGKLCDIAPTILHLLDVDKPSEMTGQSIIMEEK